MKEDMSLSDSDALHIIAATIMLATHRMLNPDDTPPQLVGRALVDANCLFKQLHKTKSKKQQSKTE